jgi:hypothetical protein
MKAVQGGANVDAVDEDAAPVDVLLLVSVDAER